RAARTVLRVTLNFVCVVISFFFWCSRDLRHLHSFPTRRSSDLEVLQRAAYAACEPEWLSSARSSRMAPSDASRSRRTAPSWSSRPEEHTSELQSRSDLVCRLLLEKKNWCILAARPSSAPSMQDC